MPFKDMREFIVKLEKEGELIRVRKEVDWNMELGAISRVGLDRRLPALLFERIKGYPAGFTVLANIHGATKPTLHGRVSLAFDLPRDTPTSQLVDELARRLRGSPVNPRIVGDGPCKENILKGKEADMLRFPVPFIHGLDGGRFIGTWHIDVTKDLYKGEENWGMYRHHVFDGQTMGILASEVHHGAMHMRQWENAGKDMPFAMAIGTEPVSSIVSGTRLPHPPDEATETGMLRGAPVELVKCETVDLHVPAESEIVVEGIIKPNERHSEGAFGEYTGYDAGGVTQREVIHVTCITHRNNPILTISNMGKPWDEALVVHSAFASAVLGNSLRKVGLPFKQLYRTATSIIIAAKPLFAGYSRSLASAVWSSEGGLNAPYVIIVGEDVDPTNLDDVFWCLTTRMHPANGIHVEKGTVSTPLMPFITPEERATVPKVKSSRALFDATFPYEWSKEQTPEIIDLDHAWPDEVRMNVLSRWKEYGLP